MNSEAKYVRPARVLMITAFVSTWYIGAGSNQTLNLLAAVFVLLVGIGGSWLRRESLPLCLVAPPVIAGIYATADIWNLNRDYIPLVLTGVAGLWLLVSGFRPYSTIGCLVNASYSFLIALSIAAYAEGTDSVLKVGQVIAMAGLVMVALGLARKLGDLIPIGAVISMVGTWLIFTTMDSLTLDVALAPLIFALVIIGMYARKLFAFDEEERQKANLPTSWTAYSAPILLYGFAAFYESINSGDRIHSLFAGIMCIFAISIGAWRKLMAPLLLGTMFLILFIVREVFNVASGIPIWAWIGAGALVLIGVAVVMEKSQMTGANARKKISAVVSDTFE